MQPDVFSNDIGGILGWGSELSAVLIPELALNVSHPPAHTRTRTLVDRAFTSSRVNAMESKIQAIVDGLFVGFIGRARLEVLSELSMLLPVMVIAEQFGVPKAEFRKFKEWSDAILTAFWLQKSEEQ